MTIFEELDKLSFKTITPEQFKQYVRNNSAELLTLQNDIPVYAYAGLLTLECLKTLHESYNDVKDTLQNVNAPWEVSNINDERAIHFVTESNITQSLKYLILDVGVDVNAKNNVGNTALHIACSRNFIEIVTILLHASNADINLINSRGSTPIMIAVLNNHVRLASILLKSKPLFLYTFNDVTYDVYDTVQRTGSSEMKNLFKKSKKSNQLKKKMVQSKRKTLLERKEMMSTYKWYCSSLKDDLGIRGVISFAKHMNIPVDSSMYASKTEMKQDLCNKIAKKITMMSIFKRVS